MPGDWYYPTVWHMEPRMAAELKKMSNDVKVERAEFALELARRDDEGKVISRTMKKTILDPDALSITENQQYEKELGPGGSVIKHKKVGRPTIVISGFIDGMSNSPEPTELEIKTEQVAHVITFTFLWNGADIGEYAVSQEKLMTSIWECVGVMIDLIQRETSLGRDVINEKIYRAVKRHL